MRSVTKPQADLRARRYADRRELITEHAGVDVHGRALLALVLNIDSGRQRSVNRGASSSDTRHGLRAVHRPLQPTLPILVRAPPVPVAVDRDDLAVDDTGMRRNLHP